MKTFKQFNEGIIKKIGQFLTGGPDLPEHRKNHQKDGHYAGRTGKSKTSNPHAKGSEEHADWNYGFEKAKNHEVLYHQ
jgi:hypothetical protein